MIDEEARLLMKQITRFIVQEAPAEVHVTVVIIDPADSKLSLYTNNCLLCAHHALAQIIEEQDVQHEHGSSEPKWKM